MRIEDQEEQQQTPTPLPRSSWPLTSAALTPGRAAQTATVPNKLNILDEICKPANLLRNGRPTRTDVS